MGRVITRHGHVGQLLRPAAAPISGQAQPRRALLSPRSRGIGADSRARLPEHSYCGIDIGLCVVQAPPMSTFWVISLPFFGVGARPSRQVGGKRRWKRISEGYWNLGNVAFLPCSGLAAFRPARAGLLVEGREKPPGPASTARATQGHEEGGGRREQEERFKKCLNVRVAVFLFIRIPFSFPSSSCPCSASAVP